MAGAIQGRRGGPISAINVTPFVDVVLVLLVILMVTSVQIVKASLAVDLPSAASGGDAVEAPINLIIEADGSWVLDGAPVDRDALAAAVRARAKSNPELRATISGDRKVEYDRVISAIDIIKNNGVKSFALNIQRSSATIPSP